MLPCLEFDPSGIWVMDIKYRVADATHSQIRMVIAIITDKSTGSLHPTTHKFTDGSIRCCRYGHKSDRIQDKTYGKKVRNLEVNLTWVQHIYLSGQGG